MCEHAIQGLAVQRTEFSIGMHEMVQLGFTAKDQAVIYTLQPGERQGKQAPKLNSKTGNASILIK